MKNTDPHQKVESTPRLTELQSDIEEFKRNPEALGKFLSLSAEDCFWLGFVAFVEGGGITEAFGADDG